MSLSTETKQITQQYVNRRLYSSKDLESVVDNILWVLNEYYEKHNEASDVKWTKLKNINQDIVVYIMQNLFIIKNIQLCDDPIETSSVMAIYVDSYVIEILPRLESEMGIYLTDQDAINGIALFFNPSFSTNQLNEICSKLRMQAITVPQNANVDLIPMKSKIFDYRKKLTLDFTPEHVFLHKMTVDYNPNATSPVIRNDEDEYNFEVMEWLGELANGDKELQKLFVEIISAAMRPGVKFDKAVLLISSRGNNGKGCLASVIRSILGPKACASIQINQFSKDFQLAKLVHASAIVADENDVDERVMLNKCATFKAVVTHDVIHLDRKFQSPIEIVFKGLVLQCCNSYVYSTDRSDSFYRRLLLVPMNACFTGKEKKYIREDYLKREEVLEYLVKVALETNFYSFDEPRACSQMLYDYRMENDSILQFWNDTKHLYVWDILPYGFLYDVYCGWFKEFKPYGKIFGKHIFIDRINEIVLKSGSTIWESSGKKQKYVPKGAMSRPELLIDKYNLKKWEADYKGKDVNRRCVPKASLQVKHAGLIRVRKNYIDLTD